VIVDLTVPDHQPISSAIAKVAGAKSRERDGRGQISRENIKKAKQQKGWS
jgi:hypothetical protein